MKKILSALMAMAITLSLMAVPVSADAEIKVALDGEILTFDVPPQMINERTMVPVRAIFEALGATVGWDQETQTVTSKRGNTDIRLTINDPKIYVNGIAKELDTPAQIVDERTLVPARAISEAYGLYVGWIQDTHTVVLTTKEPSVLAAVPGAAYVLDVYDALLKNDVIRKGTYDAKAETYSITLPAGNALCKVAYEIKDDTIVFNKENRNTINGKDYDVSQTVCIDRKKNEVRAGVSIEGYYGKPKMNMKYENGKWVRTVDTFTGQLKNDMYDLLLEDVSLFAAYLPSFTDVKLSDFGIVYTATTAPGSAQVQSNAVAPEKEHELEVYDILLKNDIIRKGTYDFGTKTYYINVSGGKITYDVREDFVKFVNNGTKDGYNVKEMICIERTDDEIRAEVVDESFYGKPTVEFKYKDARWQVKGDKTSLDLKNATYDLLIQSVKLFDSYLPSYTDVRFANFGVK